MMMMMMMMPPKEDDTGRHIHYGVAGGILGRQRCQWQRPSSASWIILWTLFVECAGGIYDHGEADGDAMVMVMGDDRRWTVLSDYRQTIWRQQHEEVHVEVFLIQSTIYNVQ